MNTESPTSIPQMTRDGKALDRSILLPQIVNFSIVALQI